MANIEWKQIQNVPGNPVDGFRTFMEGMRGAEAAARGIRESQIKNHQVGMQALDQIMRGTTSARGQDIQESQIDANLQAAAMRAAASGRGSGSGGAESFNRQELAVAAREHFYSGGNIDNFTHDNFNPLDKNQYAFASGIFKDSEASLETALKTAGEQLEARRLADIADVGRLLREGSPEYERKVREINQGYEVQSQNLGEMVFEGQLRNYKKQRNNLGLFGSVPNTGLGSGSSVSRIESTATGSTSRQTPPTTAGTGVPQHAQSRLAEKNSMLAEQAGVRNESYTAIERALAAGEITEEEAAIRFDIANKQYDSVIQAYNDEWNQTVMTGSDGQIYGTDYQYNEDGVIQVGGRTLSPEVSSAIQEAAEISGIPVDMQLAIYGAESNYNPRATSKKGAGGLGQLTSIAIKDVIQNYPEELEAAGISLSGDMDRLDPRANAIVSSLYMKLQNDEYLGGRNSIEDRYIAYNIGADNPFIKDKEFINANPNTPIDQIGFPTTSEAVKSNINVYRKPNGQWRTKNEVYAEIRRRMGIVKANPDQNEARATLERKVQATTGKPETLSNLTPTEQGESPADVNSRRYMELAGIDFRRRPDAFADAAITIADSIIPNPGVVKGESVSNLGATFYEEALSKAGVPTDSKTVARVREAFIKDSELNRLSSEDVAAVISFAEKGMWGTGLDMSGLRANIKKILENRENNRVEYRQFVDDSKALKKVAEKIRSEVESFNESIEDDQWRLNEYKMKLSSSSNQRDREILGGAIDDLNYELDGKKTLHERKLQVWYEEALERAAKIETMNQHLKEVFNKGISNQALEDIEKIKSKADKPSRTKPNISTSESKWAAYRPYGAVEALEPLRTDPKQSTSKWSYFSP